LIFVTLPTCTSSFFFCNYVSG